MTDELLLPSLIDVIAEWIAQDVKYLILDRPQQNELRPAFPDLAEERRLDHRSLSSEMLDEEALREVAREHLLAAWEESLLPAITPAVQAALHRATKDINREI